MRFLTLGNTRAVGRAIDEAWDGDGWLIALYDDRAIYPCRGRPWSVEYAFDGIEASLVSEPVEVRADWQPLLVDAVLAFEGERGHAFRTLRATKNRFGSATEVGLFEMTQDGLREVKQPSAMFLAERPLGASGSVVAATAECARSLLVEVQALAGHPGVGTARRSATGVDGARLAMLLAVLQRRATLELGQADVFVNVAGGLHVEEPAVDLAVASAFLARPAADEVVAFGEIGLAGEVRGVPRVAARLAEARAMGFRRVLLPASSAQRTTSAEREGVELVPVRTLEEAIDRIG